MTSHSDKIMKYNRKVHKVTKRFKKVQLINAITDRDLFNRHGLHLNSKGKEIMINRMIDKVMNNVDSQTTNANTCPGKWNLQSKQLILSQPPSFK